MSVSTDTASTKTSPCTNGAWTPARTARATAPRCVAWLEQGNEAVVAADGAWVSVGVVRVEGQEPFLCTHANGQWTDALLHLPMF